MNPIEEFFDKLAPTWDEGDHTYDKRVGPLLDRLPIKKGDDVLDLACGTGVITGLLHEKSEIEVTGLDLSSKMIEIARTKYSKAPWAKFEAGDFLEYSGKSFDWIIIYNAYPHFLDPNSLAKKLHACLKENGHFAIIHSLGRKALEKHHKGISENKSRILMEPKSEASYFKDGFIVEIAEESETHFLLVCKKI